MAIQAHKQYPADSYNVLTAPYCFIQGYGCYYCQGFSALSDSIFQACTLLSHKYLCCVNVYNIYCKKNILNIYMTNYVQYTMKPDIGNRIYSTKCNNLHISSAQAIYYDNLLLKFIMFSKSVPAIDSVSPILQ